MVNGVDHYGAMQEHEDEARRRILTFLQRCVDE
jgi:hypothetical protein